MRPILRINSKQFETHALFFQPTRWCGLNCKGCYVKDHSGGENGYHVPWPVMAKLFKTFYNSDMAWANQITISVDDLHSDLIRRRHMLALIDEVLRTLRDNESYNEERPEVHMTAHTPKTIHQYMEARVTGWMYLKMMSFSELPMKQLLTIDTIRMFKDWGVPVNYNKLIPSYGSSMDWDREADKLIEIGEAVDSIYLVIFKTPIGGQKDLITRIGNTSRMASDIVYIENILKRMPGHVKNKIVTDGCLRDTIQFTKTGFGCQSNVSRFQVWPDGTVSGCPYAFSGSGKIANTVEDILENLRAERQRYNFKELCHLPEVYSNLLRERQSAQTKTT